PRRRRLRMDRHLHRIFGPFDPFRAAAHGRFPPVPARADRRPRRAQQGHGAVSGEDRRQVHDGRAPGREELVPAQVGPARPLELIQIGNCGSPILTDAGWLLFTHGVGAMRKYCLGAALLDRDNPAKVIGRTAEPVLTAVDADRSGYVPNVVYTCGVLQVGERLLVPYGISDSAVGFATVKTQTLLDLMV